MEEKIVEFLRKHDYILVKELGQGACGKTVLLRDDIVDEHFVCKKYFPYSETRREELFTNFVREIKLLHQVYHTNVIRLFNYYLYPEQFTGYILMEHVDGKNLDDYVDKAPEDTNEIFLQTIEGFRHLETHSILHRDIRPQNIMVRNDGIVKIIDLGFGKKIDYYKDFDRSISLNWWCEPPTEFQTKVYNFTTEVYFVGKLFEKLIKDHGIDHFKFSNILGRMCTKDPELRISSFFNIQKEIQNSQFDDFEYSTNDLESYRTFAYFMTQHLSRIENGTKYVDDVDRIKTQLDDVYKKIMLEETAPDAALILRCFLDGTYYYRKEGFDVSAVKDFLRLLKSATHEKSRIILANLHTRIDSIPRYSADYKEEDIPF